VKLFAGKLAVKNRTPFSPCPLSRNLFANYVGARSFFLRLSKSTLPTLRNRLFASWQPINPTLSLVRFIFNDFILVRIVLLAKKTILLKYLNLTRYRSGNNFVWTIKIIIRTLKLVAKMSKFFAALLTMFERST